MRDVGTVLTDIEGADQEASSELERAVAAYEAGPGPGEQHWFAGKPLASIDLASLQLRSGALDAAVTTLTPVLAFLRAADQRADQPAPPGAGRAAPAPLRPIGAGPGTGRADRGVRPGHHARGVAEPARRPQLTLPASGSRPMGDSHRSVN